MDNLVNKVLEFENQLFNENRFIYPAKKEELDILLDIYDDNRKILLSEKSDQASINKANLTISQIEKMIQDEIDSCNLSRPLNNPVPLNVGTPINTTNMVDINPVSMGL